MLVVYLMDFVKGASFEWVRGLDDITATGAQRVRNPPSVRVMTSQVSRGSHGLLSALKVIGGRMGSLAHWDVFIVLACARFTSLYIYIYLHG